MPDGETQRRIEDLSERLRIRVKRILYYIPLDTREDAVQDVLARIIENGEDLTIEEKVAFGRVRATAYRLWTRRRIENVEAEDGPESQRRYQKAQRAEKLAHDLFSLTERGTDEYLLIEMMIEHTREHGKLPSLRQVDLSLWPREMGKASRRWLRIQRRLDRLRGEE